MSAETPARRRVPAALIWIVIPVAIAALAFIWWTASPLFISTRVDEAFPTAAPAAQGAAMIDDQMQPTVMADQMQPTAVAAMADDQMQPTAMADQMQPTAAAAMADDQMQPTAAAAMADDQMQPTAMADQMQPTAAAVAQAQPTAMPIEPVALTSGGFTVIDRLHGAEGMATIYQLPDGQRVLRLEPFVAQNGPDLRIGLAAHPMPRSSTELHDTGAGYLELEGLKASEGSQNYSLPADLDLSAYQSVVIYCRAFSVIFSTAELQ